MVKRSVNGAPFVFQAAGGPTAGASRKGVRREGRRLITSQSGLQTLELIVECAASGRVAYRRAWSAVGGKPRAPRPFRRWRRS